MKQVLSKIHRKIGSPLHKSAENNWHREAVGGRWDEMGQLQLDYLVQQGLTPQSRMLDVGCGSLRGGVHFIKYLETGRYFGIDASPEILGAGREELKKHNLADKKPTLELMDDFGFPRLNQTFDYALAQSVFTHLPLNNIMLCVMNMEKVLAPGGKFYATFFENPKGKFNLGTLPRPWGDGSTFPTYFDRDPFHYDFETFEWICEGTKLKVNYIGDWNHPREQHMMVFVKE